MSEANRFGLVAIGKAGAFTVEVLRGPKGGWLLSIDSPSWCFDFDLAAPNGIEEFAAFLGSHAGTCKFAELSVGMFRGAIVRIIKDDEFADRWFLRASEEGLLVEFTLAGSNSQDFLEAVAEAAAAASPPGDAL